MKKSVILCFCNVVLSLVLTLACIQAVPVQASPLQSKTITGVITSGTDGFPLIGVSVQVQENSTGSITDLDGRYSVQASEGQTLVFSYIGFKSQTIKIGTSSIINVVLIEDNEMLDEVVVVGYGVQKKKLVTGATVQVKGDKIAELNTTNPLQAMQGQTPGVNITSISGQPGESLKVSIRGLGTIGNAEPLYLIDGVRGDISNLNPADIESIDILKDAASAAIYGAQAANGVVLVTTKNGKEGKAVVSFDGYFGVQNVAKEVNLLNTEQYMMIMDESHRNSTGSGYNWSGYKSIYDANGNLYDVDWLDKMFEDNAQMQSYTLGITGGSTVSQYAISLGYMSQEGIVGGKDVSNFSRYNFRINSEHKLFKNLLKVGEQVSFVYRDKTGVGVGGQYDNSLRGAYEIAPFVPIYSDNNIYDMPYNDTSNSDWNQESGNPYGLMMMRHNQNKNVFFSGNAYAELQPIKNLKIRTVFGANYSTNEYRNFNPIYQFGSTSRNTNTSVTQNMQHVLELTWTNTATYDWKVNDHAFNALIGMESYQYNGTYLSGSNSSLKEGFDDWEHAYISNGTASSTASGLGVSGYPLDENRTVSYFVRFGWNWKETYMLNATVRADGSSKFAKGHRWGFFPSASVGYRISEESFIKEFAPLSFITNWKLRASYGAMGDDGSSSYQYLSGYDYPGASYVFGDVVYKGLGFRGLPNELITWYKSKTLNVGTDLDLWNGMLSAQVDFFWRYRDGLLGKRSGEVPGTIGAELPEENLNQDLYKGFEIVLGHRNKINDFNYSVSLNFALTRRQNRHLEEGDAVNSYDRWRNKYSNRYSDMGWAYGSNGQFTSMEDIWRSPIQDGQGGATQLPGDWKYEDWNGDGIIDDNDVYPNVYEHTNDNGNPKMTFGATIAAEWKGFDVNLLFQGGGGFNVIYFEQLQYPLCFGGNGLAHFYDRYRQDENGNWIPGKWPTTRDAGSYSVNYARCKQTTYDASYLRLKSVEIGYTIPQHITRKFKVDRLRIFANGYNLFTLSNLDFVDPEHPEGNYGYLYPIMRNFNFGLNLSF